MNHKIEFKVLGKTTSIKNVEGLLDLKNPDIIPNSFFMLLIGKPGAGKSTIIEELLLNPEFMNAQFDYILIFAPYPFTNLNCKKNENYFSEFDLKIIYEFIEEINEKHKDDYINLLIVFDDLISHIHKAAYEAEFLSLFYNRRHLIKKGCISIIMTTQKFIVVPPQIRPCVNCFLTFQLNSSEYQAIKRDLCSWIEIREIVNILKNVFDFIFINLVNGNKYINFERI